MQVGEWFEIIRECGEKHRRNPLKSKHTFYKKIYLEKVCAQCNRITRSRTRIVLVRCSAPKREHTHGTGKSAARAMACKYEEFKPGPCDSPYCVELSRRLKKAEARLDWWDFERIKRDVDRNALKGTIFRLSEYPEMQGYRYHLGAAPSRILDDVTVPMEQYMVDWGRRHLEGELPPPVAGGNCTAEEEEEFSRLPSRILVQQWGEAEGEERSIPPEVKEELDLEKYLDEHELDGYDPG
jgi:hypothetical protein